MNTKQLVVICYAGVVIVAILFFYAADHSWTPLPLIACTIAAAALLVYTFRPLPNVNKKRLLVFVVPFVLLLSLVGLLNYSDSSSPARPHATRIAVESTDLEFFDVRLTYDSSYRWILYGRVSNKSSAELNGVRLKVLLFDDASGQLVDTARCTLDDLSVRAGEATGFQVDYLGFGKNFPPDEWRWSYEIVEAWRFK